ncbi:hypothetical protein HGRIS_005962 [Hohenbuehelia grisea]|uniref:ENTH domain-containing protein n=1 Tax=Hohenbuehelia grisea TaxID=104357 RepID=A0ABR3JYD9_9AGAR
MGCQFDSHDGNLSRDLQFVSKTYQHPSPLRAHDLFHFSQNFNEIMPCIYARFMEKEARQWRQIYKALQLLEYLVKHGSERVVDDARSHISTIKMLRNFHYIDDKGKDEGLNVRNRAKELVEMLSDVDKIRTERRKAKANKHKYTGVGNDGFGGDSGMSFNSGGSRYGGFGSESASYGGNGDRGDRDYGGYSGRSNYGGSSSGGFRDEARRGGGFEEYDAGDDEDTTTSRSSNTRTPTRTSTTSATRAKETKPAPAPVQEVDLLGGFGDDDGLGSAGTNAAFATNKALPAVAPPAAAAVSLDDDDFDDFQAAPTSPAAVAPTPAAAAPKMNLMDMLAATPAQPAAISQPAVQSPPGYGVRTNTAGSMGMGMGMGMTSPTANSPGMGAGMYGHRPSMSGSFGAPQQNQTMFGAPAHQVATPTTMVPTKTASTPGAGATPAPAASKGGAFDDLWSMSLGSSAKPATGAGTQNKSIKDLQQEKVNASLWGGAGKPAGNAGGANAFGSFGGMGGGSGGGAGASSSGGDDLLL